MKTEQFEKALSIFDQIKGNESLILYLKYKEKSKRDKFLIIFSKIKNYTMSSIFKDKILKIDTFDKQLIELSEKFFADIISIIEKRNNELRKELEKI
jgi:hypothetical protein